MTVASVQATVEQMRRDDREFITAETVAQFAGCSQEKAAAALRGMGFTDAQIGPVAEAEGREFDSFTRRKYILVAEWLGSREGGQRTARWFKDRETGTWYVAESWKRPNLRGRMNAEQSAFAERMLARAVPATN